MKKNQFMSVNKTFATISKANDMFGKKRSNTVDANPKQPKIQKTGETDQVHPVSSPSSAISNTESLGSIN